MENTFGKKNTFGMKTSAGNALVQRVVDAAILMVEYNDATMNDACEFIKVNLKRLAASPEFADADTSSVRMSAFYDLGAATKNVPMRG